MRTFLFSTFACIAMLVACDKKNQSASLPRIFIESLSKQKIEMLEPYFPTVEFYKSLERDGSNQSDSAALTFVEASNIKLKENWTKISERIKTDNIDLSKVKIIEIISAQPFWSKKILRKVVVYSYENKKWDDMEFIVGEFNNKNLLLEIPDPEKVFSMKDSSLKTSNDARFEIEIRTPEFKKMLQDKVDKIITYAKENKVKEFTESLVYRGDDETRNSKSALTTNDEGYEQIAAEFMEKINKSMEDCGKPTYGDVNNLNLPEGMWIVIQVKCSNKIVHFAFISIDDKLLLNDVDVMMNK